MDKKTTSILVVLFTVFCCGLPGLCGLCFGSLSVLGSFTPNNGIPPEDIALTIGVSVMVMGLSLIAVAIPLGIGIWNWWSRKAEAISLDEVLIPDDDF